MLEQATCDEEPQTFPVGEEHPGTIRCKLTISWVESVSVSRETEVDVRRCVDFLDRQIHHHRKKLKKHLVLREVISFSIKVPIY